MPPNADIIDAGKRAEFQALKDVESSNLGNPIDRKISVSTTQDKYSIFGTSKKSAAWRSAVALPATCHHQKAVLEIPLQYTVNSDNLSGLSLQQKSHLSIVSSFPIHARTSAAGNRQATSLQWSVSSGIRGNTGYTTGSVDLRHSHHHDVECQKSSSKTARCTTLSAGIGMQPDKLTARSSCGSIPSYASPTLRLGISTTHKPAPQTTSSFSANLHFPKLSATSEPCLLSVSATNQRRVHLKPIPASMNVRAHCVTMLDPLSPRLNSVTASVSLSPSVVASVTAEEKPSWLLQVGCSKQKDKIRPLIGISISLWLPKLKALFSRKLFEFSVQWRGTQSWHVGGLWKLAAQNADGNVQNRHVGVGVTLGSTAGANKAAGAGTLKQSASNLGLLSWIFTWTEGDLTLRVPILLTSAASATTIFNHQATQIFYLSFLSSIVQDVVGHIFAQTPTCDETSIKDREKQLENDRNRRNKARDDAFIQQSFMERQAKIRTAAEKDRDGLVIHRAVYFRRRGGSDGGGDGEPPEKYSEYIDVTIPLQFWVSPNESKLDLYGAPQRSSMLGFYELTEHSSKETVPTGPSFSSFNQDTQTASWTDMFNSFWMDKESTKAQPEINSTPAQLSIQYDFEGRPYEITVSDDEDVSLPSPRAKLLKR